MNVASSVSFEQPESVVLLSTVVMRQNKDMVNNADSVNVGVGQQWVFPPPPCHSFPIISCQ